MRKGFQLSEEHKKKIAEAHRGKTVPEETRQKISSSRKGFHHTDETRLKMSEAHKGKPRPRKAALIDETSPNSTETK